MLIPKQNRKLIYEALFKDGVLVAKKDFNAPKHDEIDVPNLQVIKALQSLDSKQFVKTQFSWQYYYYTLTDAGIEYLREYLHLPSEIFPATFKKSARPSAPRRAERPEGAYRTRGDRDDYRRRDDGEKKEGASGNFAPEFRSGLGRGRPAQQ
ncbi:hypothetical protein BGZ70_008791 [Mortierella alpina]|uniref:Plectin/eS10 N-terminal domain-containing protein n=1 Tax=Mortierella alpina TaxID=64518 RepID=A0A9P6J2Q8_MORAP|nr:hypothetical protein EC968_009640 [Mortierella alpina]KAF9942481.1 hypothetical protein BGZ67_001463 [Mortierella alpina]KAF9959639.1 hypothetical protein BGZ70_008791 [Mortierella alpina]KAG9323708.1 hypothetical protein KVV02_008126 [Mortierella alpina]